MRLNTLVMIFVIFVSGCGGHAYIDQASIQRLDFGNAKTVHEVMSLRPQAEFPLRIAILPPSRGWGEDIFSLEEEEVVNAWTEKLQQINVVETVEFIPQFLLPQCESGDQSCYLEQARVAAARLHANTVLFLQDKSYITESGNILSIFDLTLIGLYISPGHEISVDTRYEAALFDVANGYLYAYASSRGKSEKTAPLAFLEEDELKIEARIEALTKLGAVLESKLSEGVHR